MTRRSDSRLERRLVVRANFTLFAGVALMCMLAPAAAQILGDGSPGTPGAIEGELRGARTSPLGFPPSSAVNAPLPPASRSGRFSLQRRQNTAIRKAAGSPARGGTDETFAPRGQVQQRPTAAFRRGSDLNGTTFRDVRSAQNQGFVPGSPPTVSTVSPGLGPPGIVPPLRRPPEQDPYAPVGIEMGTILLRPAIEASAGYDSNAARSSTSRRGSAVYRVETELKAASNWTSHQLDIDLRGSFTGYNRVDNANRPDGDARIALRLDAARDLTIESEFRSRIDTESATSVNVPAGTTGRTPYYTNSAALAATQRIGNASFNARGTLERVNYGDIETAGLTTSQASRNLTNIGLRLRAGYEVTGGITPFIEAGLDRRTYDDRLDQSGFARSSTGSTVRAGSTFEFARTLTGEAALGYTVRNYEDGRLARLKAPTADASLTWSVSPLTTLAVRAQTDVNETTLANAPGAIAYRGSLILTHAFLRNLTGTMTLTMSETDYQKINRKETQLTAGARLEYKFNRLMALRGSYTYENYKVNVPGSNYHAHTFLMGMRFTP
ncbi:Putative beta-barrel porin 2 [Rhabdaerophilaceae bacterium]